MIGDQIMQLMGGPTPQPAQLPPGFGDMMARMMLEQPMQIKGPGDLTSLSDEDFMMQYEDYLKRLNSGKADYASGNAMRAEQKRRFGQMKATAPKGAAPLATSPSTPAPKPQPRSIIDPFGTLSNAMKGKQ